MADQERLIEVKVRIPYYGKPEQSHTLLVALARRLELEFGGRVRIAWRDCESGDEIEDQYFGWKKFVFTDAMRGK